MIKFCFCVVITLCAFLFGNEFYNAQRKKLRSIKELNEIVSDIIISVNYLSLDVFDICKRVFSNRSCFDYTEFIDISNGDFPSLWLNACEKSLDSISKDDKDMFAQIGTILGSCDSESQIKKLEYIKLSLSKSCDALSSSIDTKRKLYYTLSVSCGLLICLIIA